MKLGLGLGLGLSRFVGSPSTTPSILPSTSVGSNSFIANWSPGVNNVAYYLRVANDAAYTDVLTDYNNLSVGNVTSYLVNNISGLHTYYYDVYAQLNKIIPPYIRKDSDYFAIIDCLYIDGHSNEIQNTLDSLVGLASPTKRYLVRIHPQGDGSPAHYNETNITGSGNIDLGAANFGDVYIDGNTVPTLQLGADDNMLINLIVTNADTFCVHYDNVTGASNSIIYNCHLLANGVTWALAGGLFTGQTLDVINSYVYSSNNVSANIHNNLLTGDDLGPMSYRFFNTTFITGDPATYKNIIYENRGSAQTADLIYITGGSCPSISVVNVSAGASETYDYIDPSANCTDKSFVDPSKNLTLTQLTTFLTDNPISFSQYSGTASATTTSEGTKPLDNKTTGTIAFAYSLQQLRTNYGGSLISTTTPGAPVATWYDQSGLTRDGSEANVTKQMIYTTNGLKLGIDGLSITKTPLTQLSLAVQLNIGTNYDLIFLFKKNTDICVMSGSNSPGIMNIDSNGLTYHFVPGGGGNVNTGGSLINLGDICILSIRRRGLSVSFYKNGVQFGTTKTLSSNEDKIVQYLLNDNAGDNTLAIGGEMCCFVNGVNSEIDAYIQTIVTRYSL